MGIDSTIKQIKRDRENYREDKRAKKQKRSEKWHTKAISDARSNPAILAIVAKELLSQGFLNEALARNKRTTRAGDFYKSSAWAAARYGALIKSDGACMCCGARAKDGAILHVDHKKPRSKFPELALVIDNLQVLCELCNVAKSNIDMTCWESKREDTGVAYREYYEEDRRIVRLVREIASDD